MAAAPPLMTFLRRGLSLLFLCLWAQPLAASGMFDDRRDVRRASREDIERAMRLEQQCGYNLFATSNGARLLTGVILRLVEWGEASDAERSPIVIGHRDYFAAFLAVTGVGPGDAPVFLRIAHEHGEDQLIDYRRERVIKNVEKGPQARVTVNVLAGWKDGPSSYSYDDETNNPHLKVTHERRNSYRIVDFGDMHMFDDIRGIGGRATSGLLGLMFSIIGEGHAVRSLIAVSSDGLQITRTTASKAVQVTQTATVYPDGRAETGLPPDRPDLVAVEKRLKQPVVIVYVPIPAADWIGGAVDSGR